LNTIEDTRSDLEAACLGCDTDACRPTRPQVANTTASSLSEPFSGQCPSTRQPCKTGKLILMSSKEESRPGAEDYRLADRTRLAASLDRKTCRIILADFQPSQVPSSNLSYVVRDTTGFDIRFRPGGVRSSSYSGAARGMLARLKLRL